MQQITFSLLLLFACLNHVLAQHLDASQYVILPFNPTRDINDGLFPYGSIESELNDQEITVAEILLDKCIKEYNAKQEKIYNELHQKDPQIEHKDYVIDIKNYKRQYISAISPKGEKIIWINCFCDDPFNANWKKEIYVVDDGGNCFLNLKINLSKKYYYDLFVNGVA